MYILCWTSGHQPPRTVYYRDIGRDWWCTTYDRREARVFASRRAALQRYLNLHRFPEHYRDAINTGSVRAELAGEPELCM